MYGTKVEAGDIFRHDDLDITERLIIKVTEDGEYCYYITTNWVNGRYLKRCKVSTLKGKFKKVTPTVLYW